jgi:membrane-bound metal-dependent hydrolase YbcI (DUF457 family)
MAGFKTHIATSTVLGIGYGATAHLGYGVPVDQCLLAAGLCSVSGMLPDLDSDNSVPVRESLAFAGAAVPMLLVERFRQMGMTTDSIVLTSAVLYVLIRGAFGAFLKAYTRHRGMFHSLPAALIFAELAYLACDCTSNSARLFKAGGVLIGFLSHLILDEIWAVDWRNGRLKSSFGTALKLWDKVWWANLSTYAKLILLTWVLADEPAWLHPGGRQDPRGEFWRLRLPLRPPRHPPPCHFVTLPKKPRPGSTAEPGLARRLNR